MSKKTIFVLALIGIILTALSVSSMVLAMSYPLVSFTKFMRISAVLDALALVVLIISLFEYLKKDDE